MVKNKLTFSVLIPVYNNWSQLQLCLDALERQSFEPDKFEIIVIDNASTSSKPEWLKLPENSKIITENEPGSYAARNTGAKVAGGKYLAFTDSDCIPDKYWLQNSEKTFDEKKCDMIGGEIEIFRPEGGSKHVYIYEKYYAFRQQEWVPKGISCTANFIIEKLVFFEAGEFDSTLNSGGDWEFSQRCVRKGYRMVYADSVIVAHPARKSFRKMLKKHYRHICWGSAITREKYQCGQLKVLMSSLKGNLKQLFKTDSEVQNRYERLVIFYIDVVKMVMQLAVNFLLLTHVISHKKVRE